MCAAGSTRSPTRGCTPPPGAVPAERLAEERAVMLPAPALKAPRRSATRVAMPVESLQHPLAVYDELLLEVAA